MNTNNISMKKEETKHTILDLIKGKSINLFRVIEIEKHENFEVNRLFGYNSLLLQLSDWSPKYSGIEGFTKGMVKRIEWFKENKDIFVNNDKAYVI